MRNQIYKKWAKQAMTCALASIFLSACNSGADSQTTPSTPNMVSIDTASTVPVFAGTATTSSVYVHNNSDTAISNIKYSVEANFGSAGNQFSLNPGSCSSIAAHSSCSLGFTTPQLKDKVAQGSSIITARYAEGYFKQIINYAQVQNNSTSGVFGTEATIRSYGNANGYATVYLYAGGQNQSYTLQDLSSNNPGITINQPSSNSLSSGQVVAVEVSTKAPAKLSNNQAQVTNAYVASMQVKYTHLATKLTKTALVGLTVDPSNNGPILTSGSVPIINVQTSINGQLQVVNSGNSAATISAITPPTGGSIISGSNACSTSTPLASGASCIVYFSVSQAGGSSNINITYDSGAILSQNVTWYNPIGGALLQMSTSPSSVSFDSGSNSAPITVTVTNIGGYDLTGVSIPTAINTNSGSATVTTSTDLACQNSSSIDTVTTLPVGGNCTYAITLADATDEANMNMSLFIAGNYTNSSGATSYQRATSVSYTAVTPVIYGTATLSLNPTSVAVNIASTATITVANASGAVGSQTFSVASNGTQIGTRTISDPTSSTKSCNVSNITEVAAGQYTISATNSPNYTITSVPLTVTAAISLPQTGQTPTIPLAALAGFDGFTYIGVPWAFVPSGQTTPTTRFSVSNDGSGNCIIDNLTGLMWQKNPSSNRYTWANALVTTATTGGALPTTLCGFSDWRLPNYNELLSLVNYAVSDQSAWLNSPTGLFTNVQSADYWSSTSYAPNTGNAWLIYMYDGRVYGGVKTNGLYYVWPVRDGQ